MITAYFEDFTLLQCIRTPDGLGHAVPAYTPLTAFRGGLTGVHGRMIPRADAQSLASAPVLVHETTLRLKPGDVIRRERDGAYYQAEGLSQDMITPDLAAQQYAQVPVKRLVNDP